MASNLPADVLDGRDINRKGPVRNTLLKDFLELSVSLHPFNLRDGIVYGQTATADKNVISTRSKGPIVFLEGQMIHDPDPTTRWGEKHFNLLDTILKIVFRVSVRPKLQGRFDLLDFLPTLQGIQFRTPFYHGWRLCFT